MYILNRFQNRIRALFKEMNLFLRINRNLDHIVCQYKFNLH